MRLTQASKTYLDLPSFYEPPEYSVVICADDDEYAGRNKVLQKFISSDDPSTATSSSSSTGASTAAAAAAAADQDRRCRKLMEISGLNTSVELLEMGPETDQAMLRYQVEYAEAFAFVFSLYSAKTLETAQKLHDKVERGARNHHNIITMSDYEKGGGMTVPVFLIGNRDADLAPPQEMEDEEDFSPSAFNEKAEAEMKVQRDKAKEIAQLWGCAYFEVDTSKKHGDSGIDEAITGIGHFIKAAERPTTSSTASFRTPMKPPKQYRIRRLLGRPGTDAIDKELYVRAWIIMLVQEGFRASTLVGIAGLVFKEAYQTDKQWGRSQLSSFDIDRFTTVQYITDLSMDRPAATSILCEKCHGLCENGTGWCWVQHSNGKEYPSVYIHHPNLDVLKAKAFEGCALCSMILQTLVEYCKLDPDSYEKSPNRTTRASPETEDDIRRTVSRVQAAGILKPANSRRELSDQQKKRTRTFHPAFDHEKLEQLRSVFGPERVLIKPRTLDYKDAGDKLPDSLSIIWLGSIKTWCLSKHTSGLERIRLLVSHDDTLGYLSRPGGIRPESNLLSDTHLRRVSSWRKTCSEEHEGCPGDEEPRELPTRVIAVNSNDPRYVKLVNTHYGRSAVYACLSYSWGAGTQYRTTTHNIRDHLQCISISDLPGTVADAIRLCRALKIPYIWIDSLCIIQDDQNDWSREAASMASIYGSSVLTISVPNTTDCSENFLTRSLDDYSSVEVDWTHGPSCISGTATIVYDWPRDQKSLLSKSPWMERGWTLQEWVLSPRVIHCGSNMTIFDCLYGTCYESHSDEVEQPFKRLDFEYGVKTGSHTTRSPMSQLHAKAWPVDARAATEQSSAANLEVDNMSRMFQRVKRMQHGYQAAQRNAPGASWAEIVVQFCGRELTKDTDKLPALAGLAIRFRSYKRAQIPKQQKYDYLAGLWWDGSPTIRQPGEAAELPTGLLWRRAGDEFLSKPAAYRAPSWSWAALDGPIEFLGALAPDSSRLQIHDALCIYESPDALYSVKAGWIDATGLLRRAWPVKIRDNIELSTRDGDEQDVDSDKDRWSARLDETVSGPRWRELQRLEIFILFVAKSCSSTSQRVTHHGLVLKRVAAEKACLFDCFTRLGTALKKAVSQNALAETSEHHENETQRDFDGWDSKKLRLL